MRAATTPAGAKTGRGSREVGKASIGAGWQAVASREEVGNKSGISLYSPTSQTRLRCLTAAEPKPARRVAEGTALALPLVRKRPRKPREAVPAHTAPAPREGWPVAAPLTALRDLPAPELAVIDAALAILARHLREPAAAIESPLAAREYVRLALAGIDREVFGVLFLDAQHGVIEWRLLFAGTLTQTSVHPREVVRAAMRVNAAAVILAHNHPSGSAEPSRADERLTAVLRQALALVDVRVLDHLVVGWPAVTSLAERGLL